MSEANSRKPLLHTAVRQLAVAAMLVALGIALRALTTVYLGSNTLRVSFMLVPVAFAGMLFGVPWAAAVGALIDLAGFFVFPSGGAYFPGFTISGALEGVVCGLLFYKKSASVWRTAVCVLVLALPLHVFLTNLWLDMAASLANGNYFRFWADNSYLFWPAIPVRLVKETILMPFYAVIFYLLARFVLPPVRKIFDAGAGNR